VAAFARFITWRLSAGGVPPPRWWLLLEFFQNKPYILLEPRFSQFWMGDLFQLFEHPINIITLYPEILI